MIISNTDSEVSTKNSSILLFLQDYSHVLLTNSVTTSIYCDLLFVFLFIFLVRCFPVLKVKHRTYFSPWLIKQGLTT